MSSQHRATIQDKSHIQLHLHPRYGILRHFAVGSEQTIMEISDDLNAAFKALCAAQKKYLSVNLDKASEADILEAMISREKANAELWRQLEKL